MLELQAPPAMQTRTTLQFPAKMQGVAYDSLDNLDTTDLDVTASYFNEYTETRYKQLSSTFCQGVLCVADRDAGPPDLFIRASTMAMHVYPHPHLNFVI